MKWSNAIEGGIAGATTLGMISETLKNINGKSSHVNMFRDSNLQKRLKRTGSKKGLKETKKYIQLAGDLLGSTAFTGISALGDRRNAMLRGGVLGAAAGLGNLLLNEQKEKPVKGQLKQREEELSTKILRVSLFTIGGLIVGKVIQDWEENTKPKKKRKKK